MDEMTLTLNNPLTEEEWDLIEDVDFDKTNSIEFHTKHGKTVKFVKCTDERTEDLISRQAAVEAVKNYWIAEVDAIPKYTDFCTVTDTCDMILKHNAELCRVLDQLPSAQPERTCVNCGRTANNGGWYADGRTRCPIEEHYALPKDGYCHLWEKRNVTDDDYPERREE